LIQTYEQFPHKDEKYLQLLMFLHMQKHRLEAAGLYRVLAPDLDEIFDA
jgi:hypothetical protein